MPAEIVLVVPGPEDATVMVDVDNGGDEIIDIQAVMHNTHFKVHFPRVLLDVVTSNPDGENIIWRYWYMIVSHDMRVHSSMTRKGSILTTYTAMHLMMIAF